MTWPKREREWLFGILESLEWRWTPVQIFETERAYPGLLDDLAVMAWQKRLIKEEQMDDEKKDETA